jgi:UDP-N-acetylmuramoylalanine-D-glutamate ligase
LRRRGAARITPDHLTGYDGFEAYVASKARLFDMQAPERRDHRGDDKQEVKGMRHQRRSRGLFRPERCKPAWAPTALTSTKCGSRMQFGKALG